MNEQDSKIKRNTYFWNTLSGFVNASEAVIILAAVNRIFGSIEVGILTLAFSVANLSMSIGKYGMRTLQTTDVKNEYSFTDFFSSRIITFLLMFMFLFIYLFLSRTINKYSYYKCEIIFLIFILYSIEVIEDVFLSEYQRVGRLDLGAKMFSIRWIISIFVLCIICIFCDLRIAITVSIFCSIITLFIFLIFYNKVLNLKIEKKLLLTNTYKVVKLLFYTTPLFISSFAYLFINNIQKFAIDRYLTDIDQAAYGYIAMPVFVIPLLSSFIIQPTLVSVTNDYKNKNYELFNKSIKINFLFILLMTVICEIGAFFLGVPVLNLLYKTDITIYKYDLLILLLGGGCLALANYMSILITIMRLQKISMYIYIISSFLSVFISYMFTSKWGIRGCSMSYLLTLFITSSIFFILFCFVYHKNKNCYEEL